MFGSSTCRVCRSPSCCRLFHLLRPTQLHSFLPYHSFRRGGCAPLSSPYPLSSFIIISLFLHHIIMHPPNSLIMTRLISSPCLSRLRVMTTHNRLYMSSSHLDRSVCSLYRLTRLFSLHFDVIFSFPCSCLIINSNRSTCLPHRFFNSRTSLVLATRFGRRRSSRRLRSATYHCATTSDRRL